MARSYDLIPCFAVTLNDPDEVLALFPVPGEAHARAFRDTFFPGADVLPWAINPHDGSDPFSFEE